MAVDYAAMRAEYVAGTMSIATLAATRRVSEAALEKRATRQGWVEARRKMSAEVVAAADAKIATVRVDELAEFNTADLRLAKALRAQIAKHVRAAQDRAKVMTPNEIRTLTMAAEAAQRIGRLALGASTANTGLHGTLDVTEHTDLSGLSTDELRALHALLRKARAKPADGVA